MLDLNKIYLLHWQNLFEVVPDKFFDLAPVDFPYGIGEAGKNHKSRGELFKKTGARMRRNPSSNYTRKDWDDQVPEQMVFDEVRRISNHQLFFGANYMMDRIEGKANFKTPRRDQFEQFIKDNPTGWIIWDKCNGLSDFNDCELIYSPTYQFESFIYRFMWAGMLQGRSIFEGHIMQGNKSKNEKRIHPTQKPVNLYRFLYHRFLPKSVVDVCGGSFSSVIAALRDNIPFLAIDNDPEYVQNGSRRIAIEYNQLTLPTIRDFYHGHK